jgi:hypothetical protein
MTMPQRKYKNASVNISGIIPAPMMHLSQIKISRSDLKEMFEHDDNAPEPACGVGAIVPPPVLPAFVGFVGVVPPRIV